MGGLQRCERTAALHFNAKRLPNVEQVAEAVGGRIVGRDLNAWNDVVHAVLNGLEGKD